MSARVGDIPPPLPGTVTFYLTFGSTEWTRLVELFLHPPWTPENDAMLVGMQPLQNTGLPLILVEVPEENADAALALALFIGANPQSGVPAVSSPNGTETPPRRNRRSYFISPGEGEVKWETDTIRGAMRAAGFDTPAAWIARFWRDRPAVTPELAEQTFADWLVRGAQLPEEFNPPSV